LEPEKRSRQRWWLVPLLLVAYFGISIGGEELQLGAALWAVVGFAVAGVCVILAVLIWLQYRKTVSKAARAVESEVQGAWSKRTYQIETDNASAALLFILGWTMEAFPLLHGQLYGLALLVAYPVLTLVISRKYSDAFKGNQILSTVFFLSSVLALPFSSLALQNPNVLAFTGLMDVPTSRSFAFMLAMSNQAAAVYSTVLMLSVASRTNRLRSKGLSLNSLMDLQKFVLSGLRDDAKFDQLKEPFFDMPTVRKAFIEGNYDVVVALGWSVIDRILEILTGIRSDVKAAKQLGLHSSDFKAAYKVRNSVVHDGYKPNSTDAILFVSQIKVIMESLDERHSKKIEPPIQPSPDAGKGRKGKPNSRQGTNQILLQSLGLVVLLAVPSIFLAKGYTSSLSTSSPATLVAVAITLAYLGVAGFIIAGFLVLFLPTKRYFAYRFILLLGCVVFAFSLTTALSVQGNYLHGATDSGQLHTPLISLIDAPLFVVVGFFIVARIKAKSRTDSPLAP